MPGVVAVLDGETVERIIETTPNAARYFVGMMFWEPDQLENQVRNRLWEVCPAKPETVFPVHAPELGNSLCSPMVSADVVFGFARTALADSEQLRQCIYRTSVADVTLGARSEMLA